ncbi:MAG: hypothetical protein P8N14_01085 [Sulfitobacter sp.]|nr:hypothetical protein [Sulfitobacter sp.]
MLLPALGGLTRFALNSGNGLGPSAYKGPTHTSVAKSEQVMNRIIFACCCYAYALDLFSKYPTNSGFGPVNLAANMAISPYSAVICQKIHYFTGAFMFFYQLYQQVKK